MSERKMSCFSLIYTDMRDSNLKDHRMENLTMDFPMNPN